MTVTAHDWSLHRKASADQARHDEKVQEAIKNRLKDIIYDESIITSDGKKTIKVPLKALDLPHFRYDQGKRIGQGQGDGTGAGKEPGVDYYESSLTFDELAAMVFDGMELPDLEEKKREQIIVESPVFNDVAKKGSPPNWDKRRTLRENLARNARHGQPGFHDLTSDDLRYKTWTQITRPQTNAAIIGMRDVSGSMGEFDKYVSRTFYFWMLKFLRTKYQNVQTTFITHHTEAKEVTEKAFFELGESGGTKVSSAYALALALTQQRYPIADWNVYPVHFSDGDNWGDVDNKECVKLIEQLLLHANAFWYGEIRDGANPLSMSTLGKGFVDIKDARFRMVTVTKKDEILRALRAFFSKREKVIA